LQEVGEIIHIAGSGRIIVRLSKQLNEGNFLCDETGRKIAKVAELIGPVSSPYASAISMTNNIKKYTGKKVYFLDEPVMKTRKRKR
jgi:RNA-binding protein